MRQPINVGAGPNHNLLVPLARGRYFKWASHDDLYAPRLLEECIEAARGQPRSGAGTRLGRRHRRHADEVRPADGLRARHRRPGSGRPPAKPAPRPRGNDFYGVMRTDMLRRVGEHDSYYNADRTFVAGSVLQGPFHQVPEVLYFRRDHPGRASRAGNRRDRAAALDPRRRNPWRYPMVVMSRRVRLRLHRRHPQGSVRAARQGPLLRGTGSLAARFRPPRQAGAVARAGVGRDMTLRRTPHRGVRLLRDGKHRQRGVARGFLDYLRRHHPEATLTCFAAGVDAVRHEHGIPAKRLMALRADPASSGPGVTGASCSAAPEMCRAPSR